MNRHAHSDSLGEMFFIRPVRGFVRESTISALVNQAVAHLKKVYLGVINRVRWVE